MRRAAATLLAAVAHAALTPVGAAQPGARPTTRVQDCTAAGCHAPIVDHAVLHGPTSIGACAACHDYASAEAHTFSLKREGSALCTFCHIGADTPTGPVGHMPFTQGRCTDCHDPHGSHDTKLLKGATVRDLCASCHTDAIRGSHVHDPVAEGGCLGCHGAHGATHENLLSMPAQTLCFSCHGDMATRIEQSVYAHGPATQDCTLCHDAHASDFQAHLRRAPLELCSSCHEGPARTAEDAPFTHTAVTEGQACVNCHEAHGSNHAPLMKDDPVGACLACHAKPVQAVDGREIAAVDEIRAEGAVLHGPVEQGACTGCHELHGSAHQFLLAANYTELFYDSYAEENYALCFKCHSSELAQHPATTVDTRFRDGDKNLHFVHVNKAEQGRTCRTCHATHASRNPKHVAETVQFGEWKLPLNYVPTETGGSCNSGCHRPAYYDRVTPAGGIRRSLSPPPERPSPLPDPTEEEPPAGGQSAG